ncbi:MAG: hypothetical protein GX448_03785 [Planctomycetes bacterium]|nr:hypothetical protein [Planctomycetota bacterium]
MAKSEDKTMEASHRKPRIPGLLMLLPFFALSFVYLWLVVEPRLIYYTMGTILSDAPQFATGRAFLSESLNAPAGLLAYASGFLSLGFYCSWLGAVIIVLAGVGLTELTRRHLAKAGLPKAAGLAALPAIAMFLLYGHYRHPLPMCLAVSFGLLLAPLFEDLPARRTPVRLAWFCLLAAVAFWLAGSGALLTLALMAVIHGGFGRRDWLAAAFLPIGAAIAWTLSEYLFLISARQGFIAWTPLERSATVGLGLFPKTLMLLLYVFTPLAAMATHMVSPLLAMWRRKPVTKRKHDKDKSKHAATERKRFPLAALARPILAALPVALLALGLYFDRDELRKPYVLSNYYWSQKQWDKIVELAARLPKSKSNVFVNHDILRALYHTGRLPYDMFRFPLVPEAILLTHENSESDLTQLKLSDIFLELGHVNMAQKLASELVATKGHPSAAIEKLAWVHIIKGQPSAARVYLNALKEDPIYRRRARSMLDALDGGFTADQIAFIDRIRPSLGDEAAGVTGAEPVDQTLTALLRRNPANRMAFEYLMACYLVTGRVDKIVENVDRLGDLGYARIPTLYEEAILIHYGIQGKGAPPARLNISPDTLRRYERFAQIRNSMGPQNQQAAFNLLIREFGTSYFFYYSFGRVGLV